MTSVLFVCLGNICRSPTAEAVFRKLAAGAGQEIPCDSAGTGDWHRGRAALHARHPPAGLRGHDLAPLRARQVTPTDFTRSTHIAAMDRSNLADLTRLRPVAAPVPFLLLDHAPDAARREVPDPWYTRDFGGAPDLIEAGCRGLLRALSRG